MIIDARESLSIQLWDCITGVSTCSGMSIYCPNDFDRTTPETSVLPNCVLVSGDSGQFNNRIYSKLGFQTFLNGNFETQDSLGIMHCGSDYEFWCPVQNELDNCLDIIYEDPNDLTSRNITFDTTCNNPIPFLKSTTEVITTSIKPTPRPIDRFLPTMPTTSSPTYMITDGPTYKPTFRPTFRPTFQQTFAQTYYTTFDPDNNVYATDEIDIDNDVDTIEEVTTINTIRDSSTTTQRPTEKYINTTEFIYENMTTTMDDNIVNETEYIFKKQEHELPINIKNDDNKITLGIDNDLNEVIIEMKIMDDNWIGVGFGSNYMNNTHAIIYAFDISKNEYTLTERILNDESPGFLLNTINPDQYIIKIINGVKIIRYKRPFIHETDMGYNFDIQKHIKPHNKIITSIMNSMEHAYELPFIYAKGISRTFGYHYDARAFNSISLDIEQIIHNKISTSNPIISTQNDEESHNNNNDDIQSIMKSKAKIYKTNVIITIICSCIFCIIGLSIGYFWNKILSYCKDKTKKYQNLKTDINHYEFR